MKRLASILVLTAACSRPDPDWHSLSTDVEVRRDEWGVAHIYARDSDDALYALGYETARDRLFQLDLLRRRALGRTAELLGSAYTADDRIARTLGFAQLGVDGEADLRANDAAVHRALSAYAAGISAYMRDGAMPPEYADIDPSYRPEPWSVADTVAMLKAELFLLAAHPETELLYFAMQASGGDGPKIALDLFRPDPMEPVYVTPGFPTGATARREPVIPARPERVSRRALLKLAAAFAHHARRDRIGPIGASNNIALCPKLTASGGTLLENDPHLELDLPGNLYEVHFESDLVHAAGFAIPGLPALVNGHNADIAWGVTTVEADDADTYLEIVDGDSVVFNGARVAMQVRDEKLLTRRPGGAVGTGDEETLRVRVVPHHGPLISDAVPDVAVLLGNKGLSLKWPGFGVTHEARAHYDLMRARNFDEFKAALNHFEAGLLNFVYAGADGDIGYYPHATYPIRAKLDPKNPPWGVLPGGGAYEWTGERIPDDRIPQLHNPDSCKVFTANNDPAAVTADGDALNDAFYLGGTFDYGFRAKRIETLLGNVSGATATLDTLEAVQNDVHSGLAEHFVPRLVESAKARAPSAAAAPLLAQLAAWDREYAADAVEPTIFAAWYTQLISDVFADDLPLTFDRASSDDRRFASLLERLLGGETAASGHDYLGGKSPAEVMVAALETVAAKPIARWGSVHTLTFNHPLGGRYDLGPIELGGGLETVSCARYAPVVGAQGGDVNEGPNVRMVVELTKAGVTMRAALPTGQSMIVGDAHFADQLPLWSHAKTRACHFDRADVEAHATDVRTLTKASQ